jgi:formiminotetrahydrofolate cyclodeaminase
LEENLAAFLKVLDSADNSTGGGTASAIAGAMAAALIAMVARLSIGKEGVEPEPFYLEIAAEAERLSDLLFRGGRDDSESFSAVSAAYRLPKTTEVQKAQRRETIQRSLLHASRIPLANAEHCRRTLELCEALLGRSNPRAASDLECANHLSRAGLLGCVANVDINARSIGDETVSAELVERARELKESVRLCVDAGANIQQ